MSRAGCSPSRHIGMEQRDTNQDFPEETLRVWQPRADGCLTEDDAREIITNIAGFFSLLAEWDQDARRDEPRHGVPDAAGGGKPI